MESISEVLTRLECTCHDLRASLQLMESTGSGAALPTHGPLRPAAAAEAEFRKGRSAQHLSSGAETSSLPEKDDKLSSESWKRDLTLEDIRKMQSTFARDRDWERFHLPRNVLLALVGEVGELSELFQWKGEVACGLPEFSADEKEKLGDELSDVLLYLIRLADVCGVDLEKAVIQKYMKNERKYPVDKCRGSSRKYTAYI